MCPNEQKASDVTGHSDNGCGADTGDGEKSQGTCLITPQGLVFEGHLGEGGVSPAWGYSHVGPANGWGAAL